MAKWFRMLLVTMCLVSACTKGESTAAPVAPEVHVAPSAAAAPAGAGAHRPRLVILGFDGVDPQRLAALLAQGRMPKTAALVTGGWRGPLATTNPPQSPVAWAAFATGLPAGDHGIFDFVRRDAHSYLPQVATTRVSHAEMHGGQVTAASAVNLRQGAAFWDVIARAGVATRVITVPYAFPPPSDGARSLAGLGTPDIRGTNSSFTYLTTDASRVAKESPAGGQLALLQPSGTDTWHAALDGPSIKIDGARRTAQVTVTVHAQPTALQLEVGGVSHTVPLGGTTPYVGLAFDAAPALQIRAATRFTVRSLAPTPEVYVEPLSIVPSAPYLPLSSPATFAASLWDALGAFKTVGWVDDTSALGAGAMDEAQFLREAYATMGWTEKAVLAALHDDTDRLVVAVFTTPDRIGHMFYRYLDPRHPARPANAAQYATALDDAYVQIDSILGRVQAALQPDDTLVVMSDHGFGSFRRGFNMNRWLIKNGYLTLRRGIGTPRDFFADVDWARSRAYAFGTGGIYLNIKGREAEGIVPAALAPALAQRIAKALLGVRDGQTRVVLGTYLGDALYSGPERANAPDIRVAMADGYRASWATSLGGMPAALFEDNTKKWSGDHASARPEDVPGILLSNRPVRLHAPRIEDLSQTAYGFTGVKPPPGVVGRSLFKEEAEHAAR